MNLLLVAFSYLLGSTASFSLKASLPALRNGLFGSRRCSFSASRLYQSLKNKNAAPRTTNTSQDSSTTTTTTTITSITSTSTPQPPQLPAWKSHATRVAMIAYIAGMCVMLPATLYPQRALHQLRLISRETKESWALRTGCFWSRWMLRLVPFCRLAVVVAAAAAVAVPGDDGDETKEEKEVTITTETTTTATTTATATTNDPVPSIWVCNHTSMLDVFLLMAADKRLRGRTRRPIKIVYWKQLEANPVTRLLFRQSGFISVDMEANGSGVANAYDKRTFKKLLQDCKQAFAEGYDIGLLPEGQLNPHPEQGLLPVFSGAYTLAKMSRRPIQMMALHGAHQLWHPNDGMKVTGRHVRVRCYPHGRTFRSPEEFKDTFSAVVGNFGATGRDLPELQDWLTGVAWETQAKMANGTEA